MRAATSKLREMPWLVASMTGAPGDEFGADSPIADPAH